MRDRSCVIALLLASTGGEIDFATTCPGMTTIATGTCTANGYAIDGSITMTIALHITGKKISDSCQGVSRAPRHPISLSSVIGNSRTRLPQAL